MDDPQTVRENLERFNQDGDYLQDHREELLAQYPEQWVAVYDQGVVGADKTMKRLIRQLEQRGLRPGHVYTEFLTANPPEFVLRATASR